MTNQTEGTNWNFKRLSVPTILIEQVWPEGISPLVCIRTMTYNHENHIQNCIEGILMQKTTFPVRVCIHDDASTDNTANIVRDYHQRYPNLILPFYQAVNSYRSPAKREMRSVFFKNVEAGEYIALCEGDDYWIDPLKLQKQIDFLEANEDCSLVFTGCKIKKLNGESKKIQYPNIYKLTATDYIKADVFMATASLLYRRKILCALNEDWMFKSFASDFIYRYCSLLYGNIGHIPDITCVYNKGVVGSWTKRKKNKKIILKEYLDNLRGLNFLSKHRKIPQELLAIKREILKQQVFYKYAKYLGGSYGLIYLVSNINRTNMKYIFAYLKGLLLNND